MTKEETKTNIHECNGMCGVGEWKPKRPQQAQDSSTRGDKPKEPVAVYLTSVAQVLLEGMGGENQEAQVQFVSGLICAQAIRMPIVFPRSQRKYEIDEERKRVSLGGLSEIARNLLEEQVKIAKLEASNYVDFLIRSEADARNLADYQKFGSRGTAPARYISDKMREAIQKESAKRTAQKR